MPLTMPTHTHVSWRTYRIPPFGVDPTPPEWVEGLGARLFFSGQYS